VTPNHELEPLGLGAMGENYPRSILNRVRGSSALCSPTCRVAFRPSSGPAGVGSAQPQPSPMNQPEIRLNIAQIATLLGVTRYTIDRMIDLGQAPPLFYVGRRRYSTPSLVRKWLSERNSTASSPAHAA